MFEQNIIAKYDDIALRDRLPEDAEVFLQWQKKGQWRHYDAPWIRLECQIDDEEFTAKFIDSCLADLPTPRKTAMIVSDETPIGWINRYAHNNSPDAWLLGIAICDDDYLEKGIGTISLKLWVDYLFANSDYHRLGLEIWSYNERMIKLAERIGFKGEGVHRELRQWGGKWLDLYNYGMLREEWGK